MAPGCQEKNAKGLTMVAIGVNKAAEQYLILDDQTRAELANGKYHDQRRGTFGPAPRAPRAEAGRAPRTGTGRGTAGSAGPARRASPPASGQPGRRVPRRPWSKSQEKLALLYNEQRLRPDEIAQKLGLSSYLVTQIILTARNRGKL
jgi:hypothetical protein